MPPLSPVPPPSRTPPLPCAAASRPPHRLPRAARRHLPRPPPASRFPPPASPPHPAPPTAASRLPPHPSPAGLRTPPAAASRRALFFTEPRSVPRRRKRREEMFTNAQHQVERTGRGGTPRDQYLQDLVTQFQESTDEESKERIVANLSNFAYDPYNYSFMRKLNVLELFLDCITEPNERLVEFGVGGICNSCVDPANASIITQCGGIPLVVQCLSSPVRNTVNYALGALYYLCNPSTKKEILKPDVLRVIRDYSAAGAVNSSFSNLANAFLDKHVDS